MTGPSHVLPSTGHEPSTRSRVRTSPIPGDTPLLGSPPPCQPPCPSSTRSREVTAGLCPRPLPALPSARNSSIRANPGRGSGLSLPPLPPSRHRAPLRLKGLGCGRGAPQPFSCQLGTSQTPEPPWPGAGMGRARGRTLCVSSASRLGAGLPASRVPLDGIVGRGGGRPPPLQHLSGPRCAEEGSGSRPPPPAWILLPLWEAERDGGEGVLPSRRPPARAPRPGPSPGNY